MLTTKTKQKRSKIKFAEEITLYRQQDAQETTEFKKIMAECAAVMGPLDVDRRARNNLGI